MEWRLDSDRLAEILHVFWLADKPDPASVQQVHQAVDALKKLADGECYLITIFADMHGEKPEVRQAAGLFLKNRVLQLCREPGSAQFNDIMPDRTPEMDEQVLQFVKQKVLSVVGDNNKSIRETAGSIITSIVTSHGFSSFPQAVSTLLKNLDNQSPDIADGAFSAINKIVEDRLDQQKDDDVAFLGFCQSQLAPVLLTMCQPRRPIALKIQALKCFNHFASRRGFAPGELLVSIFPQYWSILGAFAADTNPLLRRQVVIGMTAVLNSRQEALLEAGGDAAFVFMTDMLMEGNYDVRMEAAEFWQKASMEPNTHPFVRLQLSRLIPILIVNTKFSEWDYLQMDASQLENDNSEVPDKAQDVAPTFHSNDADSDEGDDEAGGAWGAGWTLRKSSAFILDKLSVAFSAEVLREVMPLVEARLRDPDWEIRESAVLTLGAIAPGCMIELGPFVPRVLGVLLSLCDDTRPPLRSISAWCASRFSLWLCNSPDKTFLDHAISKLASLMTDRNKRVQEAACSAFAFLSEDARSLLFPRLTPIAITFNKVFSIYQTRCLLILYDALGTLIEGIGAEFTQNTEAAQLLLDPLMHKWQNTLFSDPTIVALFECMSTVVSTMKREFQPMAPAVMERCVLILTEAINSFGDQQAANTDTSRQHIEVTLDLLSAVTEALGDSMPELLSRYNVVPLLERCCCDRVLAIHSSVHQSAFALVGDLAKYCSDYLVPSLPNIVPQLTQNLVGRSISVCQNAGWAMGQLAQSGKIEAIEPFVEAAVQQLSRIILFDLSHRSLAQNACITLARIGLACPNRVAPLFQPVVRRWCMIVVDAPNDVEKLNACQGLCRLIEAHPAAANQNVEALVEFAATIVSPSSYRSQPPPPDRSQGLPQPIIAMMQQFLEWLRSLYPQEVQEAMTRLGL